MSMSWIRNLVWKENLCTSVLGKWSILTCSVCFLRLRLLSTFLSPNNHLILVLKLLVEKMNGQFFENQELRRKPLGTRTSLTTLSTVVAWLVLPCNSTHLTQLHFYIYFTPLGSLGSHLACGKWLKQNALTRSASGCRLTRYLLIPPWNLSGAPTGRPRSLSVCFLFRTSGKHSQAGSTR